MSAPIHDALYVIAYQYLHRHTETDTVAKTGHAKEKAILQ